MNASRPRRTTTFAGRERPGAAGQPIDLRQEGQIDAASGIATLQAGHSFAAAGEADNAKYININTK
jgi:hypothetical protein